MMSESEIKDWREKEKERLPGVIDPMAVYRMRITINVLNGVLGDE